MKSGKFMAAALGIFMVFALAACNKPGGTEVSSASEVMSGQTGGEETFVGTYDVKLWVPADIADLTGQQVEAFNASNEDGIIINATVERVMESEAATRMMNDIEAGGDLFCFSQDHFAKLVREGALARIGTRTADLVREENRDDPVSAVSVGNEIYAFPLAYNGGEVMFYDKTVISDSDARHLDTILEKCEDEEKYIAFASGYSDCFAENFFLATGCRSEWITEEDGNLSLLKDTFNSAEGLTALKGLRKTVKSDAFRSGTGQIPEFGSDVAVCICGAENYDTMEEILGEDLGVCELPFFEADGEDYHLGSYTGYHLLGVKPQVNSGKQEAVYKLAQFLSGEECQRERLKECGWTPSNILVRSDGEFTENTLQEAVLRQAVYSVPKGKIPNNRSEIETLLVRGAKSAKSEKDLQAVLDSYSEKIEEMIE